MMKNVLATVGIVAVVAGIAIWQFGFFSNKAREVKTQVDRAAAFARVEKSISDLKADVDSLDDKTREYNVKARKLEYSWEREQETIDNLREAIVKLSAAAREQGLPKPSESSLMTDEQKAVTLSFNGKTIDAVGVYTTLESWALDLKTKEKVAAEKKETIDRMRAVATQFVEKKSAMELEIAKMEGRVRELEAAKDVAELNAELAEMEASVNGVAAGESGKALAVIQDQIDELNAIADSYQEEARTQKDVLNPSDVTAVVDQPSELDSYWE